MKVALDTNILACAEGINDAARCDAALDLIAKLPPEAVVIPAQTLGELFNVLVRKAGTSRIAARTRLLGWIDAFVVADTSREAMLGAADLAATHKLAIWDAVILCVAANAGCRLLLSEDLQHGFTWNGVTVVDPFVSPRNELLRAALGEE